VAPAPRRFIGRLRLGTKLGLLAAAVTTAVLAGTATLTLRLFRGQLEELAAEASAAQSDALRLVLEQQMTAGDLRPLRRLVEAVGLEPNVRWVALINPEAHVRITSDPGAMDRHLDPSSPECTVCHRRAPADRLRSVTLPRNGGEVLRTVTPILNRPACHRCHGEERRFNGVLLVDRSLEPVQRAILASRAQVAAGSAAAVFALLATLGLAVERLVLARLRRLGSAARRLGRGDLAARAADTVPDEVGDLARDFNSMAGDLAAALAAVSAEQRQLQELVDGITDGVVLVDVALKVVTANRAFAARLPAGVVVGRGTSHAELARAAGFSAEDGCTSLAQRALTTDRLEKAVLRVAGTGGERTEEIHAQPLRGADGAVVAAVEVWRDITDRLALEAGLEQSERLAAIGILASSVAHEVGNPMAAVATAVEGLLRRLDRPGGPDPGELREYLEIVRNQVFRCREVTGRLLGFARAPAGRLGPVDAAACAREVVALVSRQARGQNVEVRTRLDGPALAWGDELLVQQAILNLVLNALQAMPAGGQLDIAATATSEAVTVEVTDTGPGIAEEVRRHLFQPLRRERDAGPGAGLGLFLSQALIRQCEGTLALSSSPGRGASFTIRLRPVPDREVRV